MMSLLSDAAPVSAPLALAKHHYNQVGGGFLSWFSPSCFLSWFWFSGFGFVCGERKLLAIAEMLVCFSA